VFEFGPLWLVSLHAPAAVFGPYWAALVATLGVGGYLTSKLHLERRRTVLLLAGLLAATPILLATSNAVIAVIAAQTAVQLLGAIIGIHAGLLLHDAVPSAIRTGVSSGVGTLSWVLFLPFSLGFGWLIRARGVHWAGWVLVGVVALLAVLVAASARRRAGGPETAEAEPDLDDPVAGTSHPAVSADVACRDLVALVTDYVDGVLPADWRTRLDQHLAECDGCTDYLRQIRTTVELLGHLDDTAGPHPVAHADADL
jgi:Putative zinc-finger